MKSSHPASILASAALVDLAAVFSMPHNNFLGRKCGRKNYRTETRRVVIRGADGRRRPINVTVIVMLRKEAS
jgi:hypothetical protein